MKRSLTVVGLMLLAATVAYSLTTAQEAKQESHPDRFLALLKVGDHVSVRLVSPDMYTLLVVTPKDIEQQASERTKRRADLEQLSEEFEKVAEKLNTTEGPDALKLRKSRNELASKIDALKGVRNLGRYGKITAVGSDYIGVRYSDTDETFISQAHIVSISPAQESDGARKEETKKPGA